MDRPTKQDLGKVLKAAHEHLRKIKCEDLEIVWVFHAPDLGIRELGKPMHYAFRKYGYGPQESLLLISEYNDEYFRTVFRTEWKHSNGGITDFAARRETEAVLGALSSAIELRKEIALEALSETVRIVGLERKGEYV